MDGRNARRVAELIAEKTRQAQPFFLVAGFKKPHLPWAVPKIYFNLYPEGSVNVPKDPPLRLVPPIALMTELTPSPPPKSRTEALTAYSAAISFADAQVGLLLKQLDELKLWDTTVVVMMGDNGFHLGDHDGLWSKLTNFEQAARVPLIIVAPGCSRGQTCLAPGRVDRFVPNPGRAMRPGETRGAGGRQLASSPHASGCFVGPARLHTCHPQRCLRQVGANRAPAPDRMGQRQAGDGTL